MALDRDKRVRMWMSHIVSAFRWARWFLLERETGRGSIETFGTNLEGLSPFDEEKITTLKKYYGCCRGVTDVTDRENRIREIVGKRLEYYNNSRTAQVLESLIHSTSGFELSRRISTR